MKKKFLLAIAIVAILTCLFAIGISAAEPEVTVGETTYKFGTVTTIEGIAAPTKLDTTSRILVKDSDGTLITYPAYYFLNDGYELNGSSTINRDTGALISVKVTKADGTAYTANDIIMLEIPEGVSQFRNDNLFMSAKSLVYVSFPSTFTTSSNEAHFNSCTALKVVDFSKATKLTYIITRLFVDCSSLDTIIWPTVAEGATPALTNINRGAFARTALTSIVIPEGVKRIGDNSGNQDGLFDGCASLSSVTLPTTLTYLGARTFAGCTSLVEIEVPSTVSEIGSYCFKTSSLQRVITKNVGTIAERLVLGEIFYEAKGLQYVEFLQPINGVNQNAFSGEYNEAIRTATIKIPSLSGSIGKKAFYKCAGLTVSDMSGVTYINQHAFYECTGLVNIKFGTGLTTIMAEAFRGCTNLEFIDFGNGTNILDIKEHRTFYDCKSLRAVSFPTGLIGLYNGTFGNCTNLGAVYLGNSLVELNGNKGDGAGDGPTFCNCTNMYFVNESFSVLKADGSFYTVEEWEKIKPAKPDVYYFPSTLVRICSTGNRSETIIMDENGMIIRSGGNHYDDLSFANCTNLNKYLVFPEGFQGVDDMKLNDSTIETTVIGDTLGSGLFHNCGTESNPLTLVFLGKIDRLSFERKSGQTNYITYMFANPGNTGFDDTMIGTWYNTSDTGYSNQKEMYVIFCHAEGGAQKYKINFSGSEADSKLPVMTPTLVEATAENLNGAQNWHAYKPGTDYQSEATCTLPAGEFKLCFCGKVCSSDIVEGSKPLGHDKTNVNITDFYFPLLNGAPNYFEDAHNVYTCPRCNEEQDEVAEGTALFIAKGMTVPDYGVSALCHAIKIDLDAVEKYNAFLGEGNEIKYGVLAGVAVDGNKPVGADGKSNCDAIVMGFEATKFSIIQLKLTGLEKANKQLYCGAYVVVDGTVSYLYEGQVSDEATPLIVNNGILDQTTPETTVEETKENA